MAERGPVKHNPVADRLVGATKQAVGSLIGRPDIRNQGQLQRARADAEKQAAQDRVEAELARQEAELSEKKEELELDRSKLETQQATEAARRQVRQDEARQMSAAEQKAAQQKAAVEEQDRRTLQAIEGDELRAVEAHNRAEQEARRLEQESAHEEVRGDIVDPK